MDRESHRLMLVHRMIDEAALRRPEAPAVRCADETLTYEELVRRANGVARVLLDCGLKRGDRVGVLLGKGLDVPVSFYGVLRAGGVLVPIDPKSLGEQVVRILRAAGVSHVISETDKEDLVRSAIAKCPHVTHVVGVEADVRSYSWSTVLEQSTDRSPDVSVIELDPAYVLHTSGSTGNPKLIQHTHTTAMSFVDWAASEYSLTPEDRLTNHSSHHTCFATFDYYGAARVGATTVILTPSVLMMPGSLAKLLEDERVTVWYSVPTGLVQLSLRGGLEGRDLSALRWVLFAGETFPEKHLRRVMGQIQSARFSHVYGSTETNVCTYYHVPYTSEDTSKDTSELRGPLPIGRACSNSSTLVVDDDLQPVADGKEGELLVRGSTVMSGYWADPERNRAVLVRRPASGGLEEIYFRTGDRVRVLDDGNLTFVARADLQVKIRGHRVELEEIEAALLSLEAVESAAAFAVPDEEGSASIRAAVVVGGNGSPPSPPELLAGLKSVLPLHAVPSQLSLLDALPRTPTGKVDRNALRTQIVG